METLAYILLVPMRISLAAVFHLVLFDNVDLATFYQVFDTSVPGTFQKMILATEGPSSDVPIRHIPLQRCLFVGTNKLSD